MQQRQQSLGSPVHKNGISATNIIGKKEEEKERKLMQTDRRIHLIPLLAIICFLILYLASHDPSSSFSSDPELNLLLDAASSSTEVNRRHWIQIRKFRYLQEDESKAAFTKKHSAARKLCDF